MKSVLITGASRGLGAELLREFYNKGYFVYPLVRSLKDVNFIKKEYTIRCAPIQCDVTSNECRVAINSVINENTGILDILINNAGIPGKEYCISKVNSQELINLFNVHCIGVVHSTQGALPYLKKSNKAVIINITSRLGSLSKMSSDEFIDRKFSYSYRIAKASQNMLSICLQNELGVDNIGVVSIHPGLIKTSSSSSDASETAEESATRIVKWIEELNESMYGKFYFPGHGKFAW